MILKLKRIISLILILKANVMKKIMGAGLLALLCTVAVIQSKAQDATKNYGNKSDAVYTKVDEMPQFPGGESKLMSFISANLKYPETAQKSGVEGKVYASFVIDKSGKARDAKIIKRLGF